MTAVGHPLGRLAAGRVFVRDLVAARRFYAEALGLRETYANAMIARFDAGGFVLVIEQASPGDEEGEALVGRFTGLVFYPGSAEAAQAAYEQTRANVNWLEPPAPTFWGGTMGHFADPEGNIYTVLHNP